AVFGPKTPLSPASDFAVSRPMTLPSRTSQKQTLSFPTSRATFRMVDSSFGPLPCAFERVGVLAAHATGVGSTFFSRFAFLSDSWMGLDDTANSSLPHHPADLKEANHSTSHRHTS